MGTIRKIGDSYYIEFYARGLLYQQKAGPDKENAEKLLKDIEGKIQNGEMGIIVREVDIDVFFQTFCDQKKASCTPRTFARYKALIEHFESFCAAELAPQAKLSQVTPRVIENYRSFLNIKIKPGLVNFSLLLLKDILDFAIKLGYLNDNPTLHIQWVDAPQMGNPRVLTNNEIDVIKAAVSGENKDAFTVLLKTGLRPEELKRLKWTGVDFGRNCLTIEAPNARVIPMDGEVIGILKSRMKTKGKHVWDGLNLSDAARLIHFDEQRLAHILRNNFAKDVMEKGVTLIGLAKLLGLNDIARVMWYAPLKEIGAK